MIPRTFYMFWGGGPMSYLRYLTLVTARKTNPKWRIELYKSPASQQADPKWRDIKQDFIERKTGEDWFPAAAKIADFVGEYNERPDVAPNFQSDFFRWWALQRGGFYMDVDQLVLKPFDRLCAHKFVYASYVLPKHGLYTPVGVIGAETDSPLVKYVRDAMNSLYKAADYCSIGPRMFQQLFYKQESGKTLLSTAYNTGRSFYPVNFDELDKLYHGGAVIPNEAHAVHWFAGHPKSQKWNLVYTAKTLNTSKDVLSTLCRGLGIKG